MAREEHPAREAVDVDIACVGYGPAAAGFLTAMSRALTDGDDAAELTSQVMPGMPPQVVCYERADGVFIPLP